MPQVPPTSQTTHFAFDMDVIAEPNPEGGEPIRSLVVVHKATRAVDIFPLAPESADRIGKLLREKKIVTATEGEAGAILGSNGQPAG